MNDTSVLWFPEIGLLEGRILGDHQLDAFQVVDVNRRFREADIQHVAAEAFVGGDKAE